MIAHENCINKYISNEKNANVKRILKTIFIHYLLVKLPIECNNSDVDFILFSFLNLRSVEKSINEPLKFTFHKRFS